MAITLGKVTCWRTTGSFSAKRLAYPGGRSAKSARGIGLAPCVLHRVRAGIVGAHRDDDFAGAVDDDGRNRIALGTAAVDRGFRDRLGQPIGKVAVGQQLRMRERHDGA